MTGQIITDLPKIVDFLEEPSPLSNLERQWLHQEQQKAAKKYHHCLHCGRPLMRKAAEVDGQAYYSYSPTKDWKKAFCRDNKGACSVAYLKTDTLVRVRRLRGIPQPVTPPSNIEPGDLLSDDLTVNSKGVKRLSKTRTDKLQWMNSKDRQRWKQKRPAAHPSRRNKSRGWSVGFTDGELAAIAELLVDDIVQDWTNKKHDDPIEHVMHSK